jgi:hypothetical protein
MYDYMVVWQDSKGQPFVYSEWNDSYNETYSKFTECRTSNKCFQVKLLRRHTTEEVLAEADGAGLINSVIN